MLRNLEQGFRLGKWRVQPRGGRLSRGWPRRIERRVEPKAMQVLLALAAAAGEFCSKDALVDTVWAGRPVSDDCLTGAIHALRQALDDDARAPQFIETRNNVGYRLVATVRSPLPLWRGVVAPIAVVLLTGASVLMAGRQQPPVSAAEAPTTVAVLPFANLSGSDQDAWFAAALTDALISDLARGGQIRVISRTSIAALAEPPQSALQIAQSLGADRLIEGSVQSTNGHVRINAQLLDPRTERHLWVRHYDRARDDIFAVQREISHDMAGEIGAALAPQVGAILPALTADDLERYLQARYWLAQHETQLADQAHMTFADLADAYPDFAEAQLGNAQALLFLFKRGARDAIALDDALAAALRFERLTGATAASHRCIGQIHLLRSWDFALAQQRYRQAIWLSPSDTIARHRLAWLLVAQRQFEAARAQIEQIRLLEPLYYGRAELATLMLYAGQVNDAIAEFERLAARAVLDKSVLRTMATAYLAADRIDDARTTWLRMLAASAAPGDPPALSGLSDSALYRHLLEVNPFKSSIVAAGFLNLLGDTDGALRELEGAVARRDPYAIYIGALPELAELRGHPRFATLLAQVGIAGDSP